MFVATLLIIQMYSCTLNYCVYRLQLNLTLQIFQGSASAYIMWSEHFKHSFVKGLFRNNPSNFYWNQFVFDRQGAKDSLSWHSFYRAMLAQSAAMRH